MAGLSVESSKERLIERSGDIVRVYTVAVEEHDLGEIEAEIKQLETMIEPTLAELREFVKEYHPYYSRQRLLNRLYKQRDKILSIAGTV